jgi:hypothetical protein
MYSPNIINFPIDNISSLDTLYEVWIFFEIIDFINTNIAETVLKPVKEKDEKKIKYFEFKFPKTSKKSVEFHYERDFTFKDKEIWVGDWIKPDFTIIVDGRILAVFDAKNYNKDSKGVKRGVTDTILAYMTYLDTNYGAILSPKFESDEFCYPSKDNMARYHSDLKLAYYKLVPKDEKIVIENNNKMINTILEEIKNRL